MNSYHPGHHSSHSSVFLRGLFVGMLFVLIALETILASNVRASSQDEVYTDIGSEPNLAPVDKRLIPKVKVAKVIGWQGDSKPIATNGFIVNAYATELVHPRWLYLLPNGDVLVAESNAPIRQDDARGIKGWFMKKTMKKAGADIPSPNRITLLRDVDGNGAVKAQYVFLSELNSPFGMALVGDNFYVANTDAVMKFHYIAGATRLMGPGELVVPLPAGTINHHWTKNLIASEDGKLLYATIGSNSNVGENGLNKEYERACILEIDPNARTSRIYASGLRNPNGLAWQPQSHELWTAVNERDELGDRLVPDYMTAVRKDGFYGWPYSYFGQHIDARVKERRPDLVAKAIVPDYALGAHTASLGLAFYKPQLFPQHYLNGAFVGQHGSWNRSTFVGYKVVYIPFDATGRPAGPMEDFLTGFMDGSGNARGRPVGVIVDRTGALLVADDVGNRIWRVVPQRQ